MKPFKTLIFLFCLCCMFYFHLKEKSIFNLNSISNELISNSLNLTNGNGGKLLAPPNPLIPRKYIPLNYPKFGKNNNYM